MCGICGQLRYDNIAVDNSTIAKMMYKIKSRGPNGEGSYFDKSLALGHTRLAVIDLSNKALQPMVDKTLGICLVFNGTIYNHLSLHKKLIAKGYKFFSNSDTEVIIKAYHYWQDDFVNYLDGMFAFAIWEIAKKRLILVRDRFGIKPLYYTANNNYLSFASNIQALLTLTDIDISIDNNSLQQQLSLHGVVPAPNTIINGIKKLCPATMLICEENRNIKEITYWQLKEEVNSYDNEKEIFYIDKTRELLKQAIQKRLEISDLPVGVLLSGGLDSSLIVALAAKLGHKNIKTFSIGFESINDEKGDEFYYSNKVASLYNTEHHSYMINNNVILNSLPKAIEHMSEPMVSQDVVAFYLLSEQVANHVNVVLSGQGADEVFGGYFWYERMQKEVGNYWYKFSTHYIDRPYKEYLETINPDFHSNVDATEIWVKKQFTKPYANNFLDSVFKMDITRLIVDDPIKRVDNMTMAFGIEARVPFMDTDLIKWSMSLPPSFKLKKHGKYPLKKIAEDLLPNSVIYRKKDYFPTPALKIVRGSFLDFMNDILNSQACDNRNIYNKKFIKKILNKPDYYTTKLNGSRLWHLSLLEFWLQTHIDNRLYE